MSSVRQVREFLQIWAAVFRPPPRLTEEDAFDFPREARVPTPEVLPMNTRSSRSRFQASTAPTNALPGSEEKIRILAERFRSGVSLWHPLDGKLPAIGSQPDAARLVDLCLAS
jgi:hypothetical protein